MRFCKRGFLVLVALMMVVAGCSQGAKTRPNTNAESKHGGSATTESTIHDSQYGFNFTVPTGWTVTESPEKGDGLLHTLTLTRSAQGMPSVTVSVASTFDAALPKSKILHDDKSNLKLTGQQVLLNHYTLRNSSGKQWDEFALIMQHHGYTYTIAWRGKPGVAVQSRPKVLDSVVRSWSWNKPQASVAANVHFDSIHMVDTQHGWAWKYGRHSAHLWYTADGGRNWQDVTPPLLKQSNWGRDFRGTKEAWLIASHDKKQLVLWHTTDGGQHWSKQDVHSPIGYIDFPGVQFIDGRHGWLNLSQVGMTASPGAIMRTSDGGSHWTTVAATYGNQGTHIKADGQLTFLTPERGWLSAGSGSTIPSRLYQTTDGGSHWEQVKLRQPSGYTSYSTSAPVFVDKNDGYVVETMSTREHGITATTIYWTRDGGQTWEAPQVFHNTDSYWFISRQIGWRVSRSSSGQKLAFTTDGGKTWQLVTDKEIKMVLANHTLDQLQFVNATHGWLIASNRDGVVWLKTTDGSKNWNLVDVKQ